MAIEGDAEGTFVELKTPTAAAATQLVGKATGAQADVTVTTSKPTQIVPEVAQPSSIARQQANTKSNGQLVSFKELFAYADGLDVVLMVFGALSAVFGGICQPLQIVLFGDITDAFNPVESKPTAQMTTDINKVSLRFVYLGIAVLLAGYCQVACWSITSSRQAKKIRAAYVNAIVTQEIAWFDVNEPMELATRVADSTVQIQEGIGRKVGDGINFLSMALAGLVIGFVKGWKLTLVVLAFLPILAFSSFLAMKLLSTAVQSGLEAYAKAGAVAQEALSNIRTVHMFNCVDHFVAKYESALQEATRAGVRKGLAVGAGMGFMFFTAYCAYGGGFYYSAVLVSDDMLGEARCTGDECYTGPKVLTVFFCTVLGGMALGQAGPGIQAFFAARAAAYDLFAIIHRQSLIDPLSDNGKKLERVTGRIDVDVVTFAYPSRPEVLVCQEYSLTIDAGETVALVGPSGSGKSTIVSLLERFYDPLIGTVRLDGEDVRTLNVRWLRQQIGLVGQEPTLFATTIMENIRYGRPQATDEEVREAAKRANAFNFIMEFPNAFNTEVGERGVQLSGGQKQRIAIARAIIKDPPILLLDEATSALDTESERVVQESLDKLLANSKRTTVIVAHRLSTIRNADRIAVHSGGRIVELGSHEELMQMENGQYRALVHAQARGMDDSSKKVESGHHSLLHHDGRKPSVDRSLGSARLQTVHDLAETTPGTAATGEEQPKPISLARIWKMSFPEWKFIACGIVSSAINATVYPIWGVLLVKVIVLLVNLDQTKSEMRQDARYWSLGFVGIGVVFLATTVASSYCFAVVGQRLTARVRLQVFRAMLHQEVGWFDMDQNTSGALVSSLATDAAILHSMTSDMLNSTVINVLSLGIGMGIAFYYSWQMTLALFAGLPVIVLSSVVQAQMMSGTNSQKKTNAFDTAAGSLFTEALGAICTVASFGMESALVTTYVGHLNASARADIKSGLIGGLAFGVSQGCMFMIMAFLFWLGGQLVKRKQIDFEAMFMVIFVLMFSTFSVGITAQNLNDSNKAKKAATNVFRILDRRPLVDVTGTTGETLPHVDGAVELKHVDFAYPSRPTAPIYKQYCLQIPAGKTVALVGASGSGKSTAIALMERFYDPLAGVVCLDGKDIRQLNLCWLRERISLVSQEPVLFAGTIAENIAMGKAQATREEVVEAAKMANAHAFIEAFPNGYETDVGDRGAQVSGGQKQRIAIARAIVRDPQVLLLDEATSALDNESERIVQASLDRLVAARQRTTVIVAHRLSTIRHADLIAVTKDGMIVEKGTHEELMRLDDGVYKLLVSRQMTDE